MPAIEAILTMLPRRRGYHRARKGETGDIGAALVDANDIVPDPHRQRMRPFRHLEDTGAIDENVDRPAFALDDAGAGVDAEFVADIGDIGLALDRSGDRFGLCQIAIDHDDQIAGLGELAHAGFADAAGAAGDDADPLG